MEMRAVSWWRPICAPDATTTPHAPAGCSHCSPLPPREKPAPERRCIAKSVGSPMGGCGLHARAEHAPPAVAQTAQPRPSGVLTGQWSSAQCSRVWSSGRWCAVSAVVPPPPTARGEGWRLSRHVIGGSTPRPPCVCRYCFSTECDGRCDGWLLAGEQWDRDAAFAAQAVVLQEWADQSLVVWQLLRALDRRYGGGRAISDILAPQLMPPQYPHVPWWYMDGEVPENGGDEEGDLGEWWPGADHMVWWDEGSQEWYVPEGEQGQWDYEGGN